MSSMNSAPNQKPDSNISLVPKSAEKSVNDQIMDLNFQLKIFNKDPEKNADLIQEVTAKMNKLQDARDAKFSVVKKPASGWNEADIDGDPLKRGNNLR